MEFTFVDWGRKGVGITLSGVSSILYDEWLAMRNGIPGSFF